VLKQSLAVDHASVWYGPKNARTSALSDVTLSFVPGELTLVMGPSGSGKTTLLSLLGCLRTPDQGSVSVEGREVSRLSERERTRLRRRIGFVFQAFRLFHSLPAIENVMIAAEISEGRRDKLAAAHRLLEQLGLGAKAGLRPDALSGGEKQRVAIARALLSDPPIILADEPTASLDFQAGRQISQILLKLAAEQQRTVVVVSHDHRWTAFADRIVQLEDGRVVEDKRGQECTVELEAAQVRS
jgi:putative ABC transport system ATP-binding protein